MKGDREGGVERPLLSYTIQLLFFSHLIPQFAEKRGFKNNKKKARKKERCNAVCIGVEYNSTNFFLLGRESLCSPLFLSAWLNKER